MIATGREIWAFARLAVWREVNLYYAQKNNNAQLKRIS